MESGLCFARYVDTAKEAGARDGKIISARSVRTAEWVRLKCRFGCGGYGDRITCPPYSPTPEQTARVLLEYTHALLVHGHEWTDMQRIVATVEREMFLDGLHRAFGMGSGPCSLCDDCAAVRRAKKAACRHPERARPSMEACGIDVFATARGNGFPIEVLRTTRCAGNYYGLVLVE